MAGDWIKMRTALAHDPAVIAIALDLDKSEFEIVGMLHHLWSWADSQSQDGHIKRVTNVWVDRYMHCQGFAQSMVEAGWLAFNETGVSFPNFDRHNGDSAKKRAEASERKRLSRKQVEKNVAQMSQDLCDKSETREEKRREENIDQDLLSSSASLTPSSLPKQIPFQKIMELYNQICGGVFKAAATLTDARKKNITKCWARRVSGKLVFQSGAFWETYFNWCLRDQHWSGEAGKSWKASLEFVTRHDIVDRVVDEMTAEGVFENATA